MIIVIADHIVYRPTYICATHVYMCVCMWDVHHVNFVICVCVLCVHACIYQGD